MEEMKGLKTKRANERVRERNTAKEQLGNGERVEPRTTRRIIRRRVIIKKVLLDIIIGKIAHLPHSAAGFSHTS